MRKILIYIVVAFMSVYSFSEAFAQYDCGFDYDVKSVTNASPFRGLFKPLRTDKSGENNTPPEAIFPVLVVFVEFPNDGGDANWPAGQPPVYMSSFISNEKRVDVDWWDAYNGSTELLSDYWQEVSRGGLHVVAPDGPFHIVLDHNSTWYGTGITADRNINAEIWRKLAEKNIADWRPYDQWRKGTDGKYYYERDSIVDFIYKIHKTTGGVLLERDGYAHLTRTSGDGTNFLVDTSNSVRIKYGFDSTGSAKRRTCQYQSL